MYWKYTSSVVLIKHQGNCQTKFFWSLWFLCSILKKKNKCMAKKISDSVTYCSLIFGMEMRSNAVTLDTNMHCHQPVMHLSWCSEYIPVCQSIPSEGKIYFNYQNIFCWKFFSNFILKISTISTRILHEKYQ